MKVSNAAMLSIMVGMLTTINGQQVRGTSDLSSLSDFSGITDLLPSGASQCLQKNLFCVLNMVTGDQPPSKTCVQSISSCLFGDCVTGMGVYGDLLECEISMVKDMINGDFQMIGNNSSFTPASETCSQALDENPLLSCLVTVDANAFSRQSIIAAITNVFNMIEAGQCGVLSEILNAVSSGSLPLPLPVNVTGGSLSEQFDRLVEQLNSVPDATFDEAISFVEQIDTCSNIVPSYFTSASVYKNTNTPMPSAAASEIATISVVLAALMLSL